MRLDKNTNTWLINIEDWIKSGLTYDQYKYLRFKKGSIKTIDRGSRSNQVEIILNTVPIDKREQIIKALGISEEKHIKALDIASNTTDCNVSDVAIDSTAKFIELNAAYIQTELTTYIEVEYVRYTSYYIEYNMASENVKAYSQICAVGVWLYERYLTFKAVSKSKRELNRYLRSLRSNFLEVLPDLCIKRHIPTHDRTFHDWLLNIITGMNAGKIIVEIIDIKNKKNTNSRKLKKEHLIVLERIYLNGNLNDRQVYDRFRQHGSDNNWWVKNGTYRPPGYATINGWLNENRDRLERERSSRIDYYQHHVLSIDRKYPEMINFCWGIDGTAHNEHVYGTKTGQNAYVIQVFDYSSFKLLNTEVVGNTRGRESSDNVMRAFKGAILNAGYKPYMVQMDDGPGNKALKRWCEDNDIKVMPTQKGISRNKNVEQLLGQMQRSIINTLKGWNGQNLTARSRNSRPSNRFFEQGQRNARTFGIVSEWLRNDATKTWNNHIIEKYEGKAFNRTPLELWQDKESKTPKLAYDTKLILAGTLHKVKKQVYGIEINHNNERYRYIPDPRTPEASAVVWNSIPTGRDVQVYVDVYGDDIVVLQGDKYHGLWKLKERVHSFANFTGEPDSIEVFQQQRNLQKAIEQDVVEQNLQQKKEYSQIPLEQQHNINKLINEPFVARKREGVLDKNRLNEQEADEKYNHDHIVELNNMINEYSEKNKKNIKQQKYRTVIHPDSGEEIKLPIR